jgi:hypothetical protein
MIEYLGWTATAVFVSSYFCRTPRAMRLAQMAGAVMWVVYGALRQAMPVVAANLLVLAAAAWTMRRSADAGVAGPKPRPADLTVGPLRWRRASALPPGGPRQA